MSHFHNSINNRLCTIITTIIVILLCPKELAAQDSTDEKGNGQGNVVGHTARVDLQSTRFN